MNKFNQYITIIDNPHNDKQGVLSGLTYSAKDNIATKGILSTGGSAILKNYIPPFSATVIERLENAGAILTSKSNLDELGLGGTGATGFTGPTLNPYDITRISGGSSGGSAVAVAVGEVDFALGTDTGDSIRKPASYCGVIGFKPTYGRISRYGVFPFATSLDHVGLFARDIKVIAKVMEVISGYDEKDMTSSREVVGEYQKDLNNDIKGKKIAVIKEIIEEFKDSNVVDLFNKQLENYKNCGAIVEYVSIDKKLLSAILPVYMVISCAEATSNNANLDGINFGDSKPGNTSEEIMLNTRTAGFSELIKRRFIIGGYVLRKENQEELFLRAQKIRRLIVNAVNNVLNSYDYIILPAAPTVAPKKENSSDKLSPSYLIAENYLAFGNFAGLPSITMPMGKINGLPVGINITGRAFAEQDVMNIASATSEVK